MAYTEFCLSNLGKYNAVTIQNIEFLEIPIHLFAIIELYKLEDTSFRSFLRLAKNPQRAMMSVLAIVYRQPKTTTTTIRPTAVKDNEFLRKPIGVSCRYRSIKNLRHTISLSFLETTGRLAMWGDRLPQPRSITFPEMPMDFLCQY